MRKRAGFTLLELMLSMAILALLAGAVGAFLWDVLKTRDALVAASREAQGAGALVERLEADLMGAVAGDAGVGAGVKGSSAELTVLTRGVWTPLSREAAAKGMGDLEGAQYRFGGGAISGRRWNALTDGAAPAGEFEDVAGGVGRLRFRYYDGKEWKESFDSAAAGALPAAVEVAIWFGSAPGAADEGSSEARVRAPDRVRVIVVADAPGAGWRAAE